jgi:hypothetical protein
MTRHVAIWMVALLATHGSVAVVARVAFLHEVAQHRYLDRR